MISATSRYAAATVATFDVNGSSRQVILPIPPSVTTFNFISHVYTADETIDGIAYTYFGDPTQWWQIANVNPEILDWNSLTPGQTILIPVT
jgi:hypothetical protein